MASIESPFESVLTVSVIRQHLQNAEEGCGGNISVLRENLRKISEEVDILNANNCSDSRVAELSDFVELLRQIIGH